MAKGEGMTAKYQLEMKNNNVHKKYMARVSGKPKEGTFTVDMPLYCSNPKHSRHAVAITPEEVAQSKPAQTTFTLVWYDEKSDTSLLHCYPVTGRTHQIRVHLQYVGHSIVNDVNYGGRRVGNVWLEKLRDVNVITLGKRRNISWLKAEGDGMDDNGIKLPDEVRHDLETIKNTDSNKEANEEKEEEETIQKPQKKVKAEDLKQTLHLVEENPKDQKTDQKPDSEITIETEKKENIVSSKSKPEESKPDVCDEDEEMRMFFNYGDSPDLNYTPFNEDRIMEIWLHSFEYTILGKTVRANNPYWSDPAVLHDI